MDRREILGRSLRAEVLRLAMPDIEKATIDAGADFTPTLNVHGAFGLVTEWADARPHLAQWLLDNRDLVRTAPPR